MDEHVYSFRRHAPLGFIRSIRNARADVAWGAKTLESMRPTTDWFASSP